MFSSPARCKNWNDKYAGKEIRARFGDYLNISVKSNGKRFRFKGHSAAVLICFGALPDDGCVIDHINGIKSDNRIENLRVVRSRFNNMNNAISSSNVSGRTGVSWDKESEKWVARVNDGIKSLNLGRFDSFFDACCARISKERLLGYHINHSRPKL